MSLSGVHVFCGSFPDRGAACRYSEPQWEPEPGEDVSDEAYRAWEERNPSWLLRSDLGVYLDSDFIETIAGDDRYDYLGRLLAEPGAAGQIRDRMCATDNVLVLIFSEALGEFASLLKSTPRLKYCGQFTCKP